MASKYEKPVGEIEQPHRTLASHATPPALPVWAARGAAGFDHFNTGWPLACLVATAEKLEILTDYGGRYTFPADRVVSVSRYVWVPGLIWGIRIEHTILEYPFHVSFRRFSSPDKVLRALKQVGFEPRALNMR